MFAERHRDGAELIARRAVKVHMPRGAESMRGDGAEEAEFGAEFVRELAVGPRLVADLGMLRRVRARPRIAAEADDHSGRHAGLDRHRRQRHAENLAGTAVIESGGKACVDAEPGADLLVMGVAVARAAADEAIDFADLQAGVDKGVVHGLDQKVEA